MASNVFTFNGVKYKLEWVKFEDFGECDPPDSENPTIKIDLRQGEKELLNSLIHEGLHAVKWNLHEKTVRKMADDLAKFLWRLGYRRK